MKKYTIEGADWCDVKDLWLAWRTYDLENPEPTIKLDLVEVFIGESAFDFAVEKTLVMKEDGVPIGIMQIEDFSMLGLKIAGIKNVAVRQDLRGNGIGSRLMEFSNTYLQLNTFDLSILYSSLYASRIDFYEEFGYHKYAKEFIFDEKSRFVHLKFLTGALGLSGKNLDTLIKDIGKF